MKGTLSTHRLASVNPLLFLFSYFNVLSFFVIQSLSNSWLILESSFPLDRPIARTLSNFPALRRGLVAQDAISVVSYDIESPLARILA